MFSALRNEGGFIFSEFKYSRFTRDACLSSYHHPMLSPMFVTLQGQALTGKHLNPLGVVFWTSVYRLIPTPGTLHPRMH